METIIVTTQHSLKSGFKPILYNKLGDIAYLYSASLVFDLVKTEKGQREQIRVSKG